MTSLLYMYSRVVLYMCCHHNHNNIRPVTMTTLYAFTLGTILWRNGVNISIHSIQQLWAKWCDYLIFTDNHNSTILLYLVYLHVVNEDNYFILINDYHSYYYIVQL